MNLPSNPLRNPAQIMGRLDQLAAEMALARTRSEDADLEYLTAKMEYEAAEARAELTAEGTVQERKANAKLALYDNGAYKKWIVAWAKHDSYKRNLDLLKSEAMVLMARLRSEAEAHIAA